MGILRRQAQRVRRLSKLDVRRLAPQLALLSVRGREPKVEPLGENAWLVQDAPATRRVDVTKLDKRTWVLGAGGPRGTRTVRRIGPKRARTDLVVDETAARARLAKQQLGMLHYLAEEHIVEVLRRLDVNCVLDVGANRGQYGSKLRRAGFTGRIVSFEPVSSVADALNRRAARDPDWHVLRYALGDEERDMEITVAGGQARMSSLLPASDFGKSWAVKLRSDDKETITVRRLDSLFDEAVAGIDAPRVYLKLDTQGYDLQAFAGAGDCVERVVGMQSEVSVLPIYNGMPSMSEQLATYAAAGFELTAMFPVIIDAPTLRVIEFDAVMIRTDALRD